MFVRKGKFEELEHKNRQLNAEVSALRSIAEQAGTLELVTLQQRISETRSELAQLEESRGTLAAEVSSLRQRIVEINENAMLQEFGLYQFAHPLEDVLAYRERLDGLRVRIKELARSGQVVTAVSSWTVNGSAAEGRKLVDDTAKLMLSAYNAEIENVLRTLRPHRLAAAVDRIDKLRERIARAGRVMQLRISDEYHVIRMQELRLTADYLQKVEEEREQLRALREAEREEQRARREMEAERARLQREAMKYQTAIERLRARGDEEGVSELLQKVGEVEAAIAGVEAREANIRAGYVYVISNVGAFGERMVKIGLTRRLDPEDRIRELGDASVPFQFDKHALIFSEDAVGLEAKLHAALQEKRVNRVNLRREFFYATPHDVLAALEEVGGQHLAEFHSEAEALEWRQSERIRDAAVTAGATVDAVVSAVT
ncbi:MAG: DUF4041 domain-containing protein [Dehalococcoidia bacterium]